MRLLIFSLLTVSTTMWAGQLSLSNSTLPSSQGWTLVSNASEASSFSTDGTTLSMNTGTTGNRGAYYALSGAFDAVNPSQLDFTARLFKYTVNNGGAYSFAFAFGAENSTAWYGIGLGEGFIYYDDGNGLQSPASYTFNTSQYHNYSLKITPGVGLDVYIDGNYKFSGVASTGAGGANDIDFGDQTQGDNAFGQVLSLTYTTAPEPSSLMLGLGGIAALLIARRRTVA